MVRRPLQQALDEVRFGRTGTLNLRASLPTAAEAVHRTENWLRMKQAEGAREVLVITGRGNRSHERTPVVREAVRRLLGLLSTRGVVVDHSEHSPGSFAVRLAPFRDSQSLRVSTPELAAPEPPPPTLDGLSAETRERLRVLAEGSLQLLGVRDPSSAFVHDEMVRQCDQLASQIPATSVTAGDRERALQGAIDRATERLDDAST